MRQLVDVEATLGHLAPFQRRTAEYAFARLTDPSGSRRFLVADEVGLGKTLVARAVVAQTLAGLADTTPRIDVVYICSNLAIARQNLTKLNPTNRDAIRSETRLTLLPVSIHGLHHGRTDRTAVNLVALTPGTSFDHGRRTGDQRERALAHWLVTDVYGEFGIGLYRALGWSLWSFSVRERAYVARARFARFREDHSLARGFLTRFRRALRTFDADRPRARRMRALLQALDEGYRYPRSRYPNALHELRKEVVGDLRRLVARTAIDLLEPDLVILDEFQRFKPLVERPASTPAAELADALFAWRDPRTHQRPMILLLSATPYKAVSLRSDVDGDDHYGDLVATLGFLLDDDEATSRLRAELAAMSTAVAGLQHAGVEPAASACVAVAESMRVVMSRTERLAVTPDRDGMLAKRFLPVTVERDDVRAYLAQARVADHVIDKQYDVVEFWKSSPWLLSFMELYELKRAVSAWDLAADPDLARLLGAVGVTVDWRRVSGYQPLRAPNGRIRALVDDVFETGAWRLAWLPPALPYHRGSSEFDAPAARAFTKRLVFSSWAVVPKAVATLLSYEAERRLWVGHDRPAYHVPSRTRLLELSLSGRDAGALTAFALLYPSPTLAAVVDPRRLAADLLRDGRVPDLIAVRRAAVDTATAALEGLPAGASDGPEDVAWYVTAPLLLDAADRRAHAVAWLERNRSGRAWRGDDVAESRQLAAHVEAVIAVARGRRALGRRPRDLAEVLADLALGSPAVAALRALTRSGASFHDGDVRDAAARVAWGFRSLFSNPELQAYVQGRGSAPYWREVLRYCVEGHLQAVLDEYVHTYADWRGFVEPDPRRLREELVDTLSSVLALRTTTYTVHVRPRRRGASTAAWEDASMRAHFAVPYSARTGDDPEELRRTIRVTDAYNSPFWPFVLVTTSAGQEGLDFHLYSHAVAHWNLPSNPVDLEQREGRVHRYKGHAVRKNVAAACGIEALRTDDLDVWRAAFEAAARARDRADGLSPAWVFQGPASIERLLLLPPLSREQGRYDALERALATYRLALGSPRQDELLAHLAELDPDLRDAAVRALRVDLSPRAPT